MQTGAIEEFDVKTADGRTLHAYDRVSGDLAVVWHHGTPNIGSPPRPLFAAADRLGIRFVAYDRPGYGGSAPMPDRSIGSAAADVAAVADALGLERFAVFGHSGGGSHALATAALLAGRVTAVVSVSGLAPFDAMGLDWFAGMGPAGQASLRAAAAGRPQREAQAATESTPDFTPADWASFDGEWGWFGSVVEPAMVGGPAPQIDDDLAYVNPWGCDPTRIGVPALLIHGNEDLVAPPGHGRWLAAHIVAAEYREIKGAGHISVLPAAGDTPLEWLAAHAR